MPPTGSTPSTVLTWKQAGVQRELELPLEAFAWQAPQCQVERILVLLHGYGDNAQNFRSLSQELNLKNALCVSLNAPLEHPQMRAFGGRMWFDLFEDPKDAVAQGVSQIHRTLELLLKETHLPPGKLGLLGFSQGGAMSLLSGFTFGARNESSSNPTPSEHIGALVSLSGFVLSSIEISKLSNAAHTIPLFLGHGLKDEVVLPLWHYENRKILEDIGFVNLTSKTYSVGHSLHPKELDDVREFLQEAL